MKLELKAIKHSEFASQETNCYEAKVYKDGKPWAIVGNEGYGGCDRQDPIGRAPNDQAFRDEVKAVNDYLKSTPEAQAYGEGYDFLTADNYDLEAWCGEQLEANLLSKDLKKLMRSNVVFQEKQGAPIEQVGFKGTRKVEQRHIDYVKDKYAPAVILNIMSFDEAFNIFRKQCAA